MSMTNDKVTLTIDELTALTFQHSRLAKQLRQAADEHDKLADIYLEAGKRFRREKEAEESKMKIRRIISGIGMLLLVFMVFGFALSSQPRTLAQDVPAETQTAEATPTVIITPEPKPVETQPDHTQEILDAIKELALIAALIALAFKTAGLVPKETFDSALSKGFGILTGLADQTKTPIDNQALATFGPILIKWLDDQMEKRNGVQVNIQPATTTVPPTSPPDFTIGSNG